MPNLMPILSTFLKLQAVKQSGPGFLAYPINNWVHTTTAYKLLDKKVTQIQASCSDRVIQNKQECLLPQTDHTSAFVSPTILARAVGAVDPVDIFLTCSLITMHNSVTVSHAVCCWDLWMRTYLTPRNTSLSYMCYVPHLVALGQTVGA